MNRWLTILLALLLALPMGQSARANNTGQPGMSFSANTSNNQQNGPSRDMEAEAQAYRVVQQRAVVNINRGPQHLAAQKSLHKGHRRIIKRRKIKSRHRSKIHIRPAMPVKSSILLVIGNDLGGPSKKTRHRRSSSLKFGMVLRQVSRDIPDLTADGIPLSRAKDSQFIGLAANAWKHFVAMVEMMHIMGYRHNAISPNTVVIDQFGYLRLGGWDRAHRRGGSVTVDNNGLQSVQRYIQHRRGY